MRLSKEYTTHIPMLIKTVQATNGIVIELGAGISSTPLLHWLCLDRKLITYEETEEYFNFAKKFQSRNHSIRFIENWDNLDIKEHYSVVFIDQGVDSRAKTALYFKDIADYIVLHDTEAPCYGYDKIWDKFKYRYDWKYCRPWTSVVSNFKNLDKIK